MIAAIPLMVVMVMLMMRRSHDNHRQAVIGDRAA